MINRYTPARKAEQKRRTLIALSEQLTAAINHIVAAGQDADGQLREAIDNASVAIGQLHEAITIHPAVSQSSENNNH